MLRERESTDSGEQKDKKGKNKGRELCLKKQNKIRKGWKHSISRILI